MVKWVERETEDEDENEEDSILFARDEGVPDSGGEQNDGAGAGEENEKGRWQHVPRHHRCRCGESATEITIERAGFETLHAFLQQGLQGTLVLREAGGAFSGANHSRRGRGSNAIGAHRPAAVGADSDSVDLMFEAFHERGCSSTDSFESWSQEGRKPYR